MKYIFYWKFSGTNLYYSVVVKYMLLVFMIHFEKKKENNNLNTIL